MKLLFRAWYHSLPLRRPYRLSFATLERFETFYVALEGEGRIGFGEITPLPGYGGETVEQASRALTEAKGELAKGKPAAAAGSPAGPEIPLHRQRAGLRLRNLGGRREPGFHGASSCRRPPGRPLRR